MIDLLDTRNLNPLIDRMRAQKILVLGDVMLDEFIYGKVSRISPEAPVPVVQVTHETIYPGGAANVARNLAEFGVSVVVSGLIGDGYNGAKLVDLLRDSGISTDGLFSVPGYSTIVKTRIIARQQQVVRVDRENALRLPESFLRDSLPRLERIFREIDAVIIEDYGKGFITQPLVDAVIDLAQAHNRIVAVDPNPNNPLNWSGATVVKPNRQEAFLAAGLPYSEADPDLHRAGELLLERWQTPYLLITLGESGMVLFHPPLAPYHTPTRAREVYDVSGAGDTVIALFTAALAAGLSGAQAAEVANHAAGVVVGKLGTATLTPEELVASFSQR
ncbi:D-glycero-beta-D-manno-heptose-7-phosphate kinase [candidate division KSB1 bacterium]|nr:D-glycero-beta-D-manno-heptose-7-phosphate kinase [candidate division KSB1 bacterium]